jgi:hypothetical protein
MEADTFRGEYRALSPLERALVVSIKERAIEIEALIEGVTEPRYRALAKTALEEAVMWAVKGITS